MVSINCQTSITREMCLWACLWGIILIILIEVKRLAHCEWHHSLAEILDYVNSELNPCIHCSLVLIVGKI